jgi:hypothetical protein
MRWLLENEVNEMYRASNRGNGYDTSFSQRDPGSDRQELKEILEILKNMDKEGEKKDTNMLGSSSNLNEQEVVSSERKKLEIYTEQDAEVERQKGYAIPR